MPKISRTDPGAILSKAVEYHGFVYLQGVTAKDTSKDIKGQTAEVLARDDDVREFYFGFTEGQRRSYRDVKHYRRKKRWLS